MSYYSVQPIAPQQPRQTSAQNNTFNNQVLCKVAAKYVVIGKVKQKVAKIEISSDRILFNHISNDSVTSKFNIMLPFNEMTSMRWCFTSEICAFVIRPCYESYLKFSNWLKKSIDGSIPDDFVIIQFDSVLEKSFMQETIIPHMHSQNSRIKLIEINYELAKDYVMRGLRDKRSADNAFKFPPPEVIELEDDMDNSSKPEDQPDALNRIILKFPKDNPKAQIVLYGRDLDCLREGQYLNDNIMNFYLRHFQNQAREDPTLGIDKDIWDRIHIFDSLFSIRLFSQEQNKRKIRVNNQHKYFVLALSPVEKLYETCLKKWTKDIDIFSKDFVIFPLLKDSHWILAILCYPGNLLVNRSIVTNSKDSKRAGFLFMDSLNLNQQRYDVVITLIHYIQAELKNKHRIDETLERRVFEELFPKLPQQTNHYDCGLFLIEYFERFLKDPEKVYHDVRSNSKCYQNWFDIESLGHKRSKIRQTILNYMDPNVAKDLEEELSEINLKNGNSH